VEGVNVIIKQVAFQDVLGIRSARKLMYYLFIIRHIQLMMVTKASTVACLLGLNRINLESPGALFTGPFVGVDLNL